MIRVWIETSSAVTRAGLESILEVQGIDVADSIANADVILREDLPESGSELPAVVLADIPVTRQALKNGVRAILPRQAAPEQVIAALWSAFAGLIAVPAGFAQLVTTPGEIETLTARELEVLEMLAEGLSNKQIAAGLGVSDHTAKFHVTSIMGKLHAGTRTEAVMRAIRSGLIKI